MSIQFTYIIDVMEVIDLLIKRILNVVPLTQVQLGYVLIGLGAVIILLVLAVWIASKTRSNKKVEPRSRYSQYAGRSQAGAQFSSPILNNRNSGSQATAKISPVGNFAPKNTSSNPTPIQKDALGGLSRLKAQAEFQVKDESAKNVMGSGESKPPAGFVPVGYTSPNVGINNAEEKKEVNTMSTNPTMSTSNEVSLEGENKSFNNPASPLSALDQGQKIPNTKTGESNEEELKPKPQIDESLLEYIRSTKSQGFSSSAIRSELVKAGWNPIEVDRAISEIGI